MHLRPIGRYDLSVPGDWACCLYSKLMNISRPHLDEITEVIEDTVQYACDQHQLSGELVWTIVECLATAKLAELNGELASV